MIKHIVMWKLKDEAEGNCKIKNALVIKEGLESLRGKIEGLIEIEVGIDNAKTHQSYDVALYSVFENQECLDNYQVNKEHNKVAEFIGKVRESRVVVDYSL